MADRLEPYFRSCDKDRDHTILSTIAENPMLHAELTTLFVTEWELWSVKVLPRGNRDFRLFLLL